MLLKPGSRAEKRWRKILWKFARPEWSTNFGVELPLEHSAITAPIRKDIFFGGYEAKEAGLIQKFITPDDVVMEVGAGIGFLSALCAKVVGNDNVHAYEANPQLIPVIAEVHAKNGVAPHVHNVLLGKGEAERTFWLEPDYWASSLIQGSAQAKPIQIAQIDLNAELARIRPSFLIVDIEGGEYEFFNDIDLQHVRKICIEVHPHVLGNDRVTEILSWLFAAGFSLEIGYVRKYVFYLYRETSEGR
jgi:FkbM family methyltransferase